MDERAAPLAIELGRLEQSYPLRFGLARRRVLHGIDLAVERGTTLALVGPNGSGKTTLLRVLAGIERPRSGVVRVLGGDPRARATRRRLAFLPEDSPFPPELSAEGVLALIGAFAGMPRRECAARARALLERVGLAEVARSPLRRYSRGMLRRFGLAQAFLTDPELVLLDEPTAGLDAPGYAVVDELLREARARGTTIVLASHVLQDVHDYCREIAVLIDGRVVARGGVAEVLGGALAPRIEIEGLDPARAAELERWCAERGAVLRRSASARGLHELYRRHAEIGASASDARAAESRAP